MVDVITKGVLILMPDKKDKFNKLPGNHLLQIESANQLQQDSLY